MIKEEIRLQPYQILFPIGLMYGLWGVMVWILFPLGLIGYPGQHHPHLMVGGFLFAFALGFLMTAVPKFTGAPAARKWELGAATVLALATFCGTHELWIGLAVLVFLALFFLSRFKQRQYSPPKHFIFIPIGLLSGIAGALLMVSGTPAGRVFYFQGTMLCLVLGVGGKLVSALLGWSSSPLVQIQHLKSAKKPALLPFQVALPAAFILIGLLLELTPWMIAGRWVRALAATFVAFDAWKLHRRPRNSGRLVNWLWISSWALVVGMWAYAAIPSGGVHAFHLVFISGFGLMTLMIATRVTLAHGGYDLDLEIRSQALRWCGALFLIAAATRMTAIYTTSYLSHLGYSAAAWTLGLLIWMTVFVPRILKNQKPN